MTAGPRVPPASALAALRRSSPDMRACPWQAVQWVLMMDVAASAKSLGGVAGSEGSDKTTVPNAQLAIRPADSLNEPMCPLL